MSWHIRRLNVLVQEHLRWVCSAETIDGLLVIFQDDLPWLLKARDLYLNDVSDTLEVILDILDAIIVFDDTRDSQVQTAEHNLLLDVFDEGLDICIDFEGADVSDVAVDEAVAYALPCITQNFVV